MQPSRAFVCLARALAAGALLAATAAPALAIDPPKGSLRSREFSAAELAVSSSHVALDDVLGELPNRGAWERFRSERAAAGAERVHVYIDPRSGPPPTSSGPFPLLPGDGVGNRVSPEAERPPGTQGRAGRRRGRRRSRATLRPGARGRARHRRRAARGAAGHAGLGQAVAGERGAGRERHHRARLAAGPDHQPRQRGGLRHRGLGHGAPAPQGGLDPGEGDDSAFAYAGGRSPHDAVLEGRPSRS